MLGHLFRMFSDLFRVFSDLADLFSWFSFFHPVLSLLHVDQSSGYCGLLGESEIVVCCSIIVVIL